MTVKPLTGQVLVQILPPEKRSAGGIEFPERTASPEENQQAARNPTMPPPDIGIVQAIGAWPRLKNGMAVLPPFGIGAKVVIGHYAGQSMRRGIGEQFKMVPLENVLAIIHE